MRRILAFYHWTCKKQEIYCFLHVSKTTPFQTQGGSWALGVKPAVQTYRFSTTIAGIVWYRDWGIAKSGAKALIPRKKRKKKCTQAENNDKEFGNCKGAGQVRVYSWGHQRSLVWFESRIGDHLKLFSREQKYCYFCYICSPPLKIQSQVTLLGTLAQLLLQYMTST